MPVWTVRGCTGLSESERAMVGAVGGCASRSICRSFKSDLLSRMGTGRRRCADVFGAVFQLQTDGHFVGRHGIRKQLRALIVEQARDQKQQRLQQADRMIQLDAVFICGFRLEDFERPMDGATSQLLQVDTVRVQIVRRCRFRQLRQLIERVNAPAFEDLGHLFGERERGDIQIVQIGRDGNPGKIARGDDGGVGGFGYGYIDCLSPAVCAMASAICRGEP